jgi:hypothetical protein
MIRVSYNGRGLAAEKISDILDYSTRTSSREAYCSTSCGAQGNALKTIIAMAYALDGGVGEMWIASRELVHRIIFSVDAVRQVPRIDLEIKPDGPVSEKTGLRSASSGPIQLART